MSLKVGSLVQPYDSDKGRTCFTLGITDECVGIICSMYERVITAVPDIQTEWLTTVRWVQICPNHLETNPTVQKVNSADLWEIGLLY